MLIRGNETVIRFTFGKEERLNNDKIIARLYQSGIVISKYPIRIHYLFLKPDEMRGPFRAQVLVNASKRKLKKAVTRNRMKRILRELYRHKKSLLYDQLQKKNAHMVLSVVYGGTHLLDYWEMDRVFEKAFRVLFQAIEKYEVEAESAEGKTD